MNARRLGPRSIGVLLATLFLVGCDRVNLYSQLSEQQANEVVAILLNAQIDSEKESPDSKTWSVRTSKGDLPHAVEVLRNFGYPQEQFQTFGQIFKKESFVSSPLEERARFLYGLSQELAHTISSIDGVVVARVHIALPEKEPLAEKARPSSASVFVKHRPDVAMANHVGSIKALVINSVEGLAYDNVTVTLFPADPWLAATARPAPRSQAANREVMMAAAIGFGLLIPGAALFGLRRRLQFHWPLRSKADTERDVADSVTPSVQERKVR